MIRRLFFFAAFALITPTLGFAQDDDIDARIKKAMENANKPASKADMNKMEQQAKAQAGGDHDQAGLTALMATPDRVDGAHP